jgi:hypothetical protein
MAAPNIVSVASILGKSAALALTTSVAAIANNAAASGKVLKLNSLYVSNVDSTNEASVTVSYYSQDDLGGTAFKIASTIVVPPNATLAVVTKDAPIYLEEDRSLGVVASANGDLEAVASWEEIS